MEKSPAVQLSFQLRTSSSVRSVHLVGSWDNYQRQLPLSAVKDSSVKPGSWKGTFRFQGSQTLKLGGRYWYYYIIDGYHVSHDPAKESVTEKTTGRKLNVLNVPGGPAKSTAARPGLSVNTQNLPGSRSSRDVVQGRGLSPQRIQCPRPQKPYASRNLREADYERSPIDDLEERFAASRLSDRSRNYNSSPSELSDSSSGPEFSDPGSSLSGGSRPSSSSQCTCGRYGVTRDGRRVKLDCGGGRCGYGSSDSSDCSDGESEYVTKQVKRAAHAAQASRRPLIVERRP